MSADNEPVKVHCGKLNFTAHDTPAAKDAEYIPFMVVHPHIAKCEDVFKELNRGWKLYPPQVVLTIISNFSPMKVWRDQRQIQDFKKGIIKAANTTNMWILTNGVNTGITRIIGDAFKEERNRQERYASRKYKRLAEIHHQDHRVIGISQTDLLNYGHIFSEMADIKKKDVSIVNVENCGGQPVHEKCELNPDHTHFLIVNNTEGYRLSAATLAVDMMEYMGLNYSKKMSTVARLKLRRIDELIYVSTTPAVSILIQGGYACSWLVREQLKRQLPVVVIRGTGGLADLLSYAYIVFQQRTDGVWDDEYIEGRLKPKLATKITQYFPRVRGNILKRNIFCDRIVDCLKYAQRGDQIFLSVLYKDSTECNLENLKDFLLLSVLQASPSVTKEKANLQRDLLLCLNWNCPDVAEAKVFKHEISRSFTVNNTIFHQALLRKNCEAFIDLFIQHGFQLFKYVSLKSLRQLFLDSLYQGEFFQTVCWEGLLGLDQISLLHKESFHNGLNKIIFILTGFRDFINEDELQDQCSGTSSKSEEEMQKKALAILAIWCVLNNRSQLAKVLWKNSDQPIHLGLVLSSMYNQLLKYIDESPLREEFSRMSVEFTDMATGVLELCYLEDPYRAFDMLGVRSEVWKFKTAIEIADRSKNMTFLAHRCCQTWVTKLFYGQIQVLKAHDGRFLVPEGLKIVMCAFLIFPMYRWVRFIPHPLKGMDKMVEGLEIQAQDEEFEKLHIMPSGQQMPFFSGKKMPPKIMREDSVEQQKIFGTWLFPVRLKIHPPLHKMVYLMWMAPITRFWTFQLAYLLYLALFSVAVLWPSCGNFWLDLSVCVWTILIAFEEGHRLVLRTIQDYEGARSVAFKVLEMGLMLTFCVCYFFGRIIGFAMLHYNYSMKILLCIALLFFYYRFIFIYLPISPQLGPLLYKIQRMVINDFFSFMRLALMVMIVGGIVWQAILYPDYPLSAQMLQLSSHRTIFSLFMSPVDDLTTLSENCYYTKIVRDGYLNAPNRCWLGTYTDYRCPSSGFWPYLFVIQYLILLKLILITLLYALFSKTVATLEEQADTIWKFQRYHLVSYFLHHSPLPVPLNIFYHLYHLAKIIIRWIAECCRCCPRKASQLQEAKPALDPPEPAEPLPRKFSIYSYVSKKLSISSILSEQQPPPVTDSKQQQSTLKGEDHHFWKSLAWDYWETQEKLRKEKATLNIVHDKVLQLMEKNQLNEHHYRELQGEIEDVKAILVDSRMTGEDILRGVAVSQASSALLCRHLFQIEAENFEPITHVLSCSSPYPNTTIYRYTVPRRYASWEVNWVEYSPPKYTKDASEFPEEIRPWVDIDLPSWKEATRYSIRIPEFHWNTMDKSASGMKKNRKSWIVKDGVEITYDVVSEENVPQNPLGRTGLLGRGELCFWGPNHYVYAIITRWNDSDKDKPFLDGGKNCEVVLVKLPGQKNFALPGGFVPDDQYFRNIQNHFDTSSVVGSWSSDDFVKFFESGCLSVTSSGANVQQQSDAASASPADTGEDGQTTPKPATASSSKHSAVGQVAAPLSRVQSLHSCCRIIYRGYMDSAFNTDNAWKEVELWWVDLGFSENISARMKPTVTWFMVRTEESLPEMSGSDELALLYKFLKMVRFGQEDQLQNIAVFKTLFDEHSLGGETHPETQSPGLGTPKSTSSQHSINDDPP